MKGEMTMKISVIALFLAVLLLMGCGSPIAQAVETAAITPPAATESTPLTKDQAEAIALEHAGFTADQVTRLRKEYEIDDGLPRFEVQFRQGRWEYDYEINANTGAILSYDRDD